MNFTIFELKRLSSDELSKLVKKTLDQFPLLKEIYDDTFLSSLISKNHGKNYLLWLLSAKNEYCFDIWKHITECLELLRENEGIENFKDKLRSPTEAIFSNYFVELHFASYFKKKGYNITLEPKIGTSGINPDFLLDYNGNNIYFEAKNLHFNIILEQEKFDYELHSDLRITDIDLVYSVRRVSDIQVAEYQDFKKYVIRELRAKKNANTFPIVLNYMNTDSEKIAELVIHGLPNKLDHGYLGVIADLKASLWEDREKIMAAISGKTRQLVKGEMNVVIVNSNYLMTDYISIQNALFGADSFKIIKETGDLIPIRTGDRIYTHSKNTRISAVLFSELKRHDGFIIFHNPFAQTPIPIEFFQAKKVKQFAIIEESDREMILDWI